MELIWNPLKHVKRQTHIHHDNPNNPMLFFSWGAWWDGNSSFPKKLPTENTRYAAEFTRLRGLAWAELESLKVPVDDPGALGWGSSHNQKIHQQQKRGGGGGQGFGMLLFFFRVIVFFCLIFFVLRKTLRVHIKVVCLCVMKGTKKDTHYSIPQLRKSKPLDSNSFWVFADFLWFLLVFCSKTSHPKTTWFCWFSRNCRGTWESESPPVDPWDSPGAAQQWTRQGGAESFRPLNLDGARRVDVPGMAQDQMVSI